MDTLCAAITERGATALPVFCGSLRSPEPGLIELLGRADAVITTVLAAGGANAAGAQDGDWDAGGLATLDVPLIQGLCLTSSRSQWAESTAALTPMDAAMQVAIPEFDGRLITVPFSFKEEGPDGIGVYQADPERAARLAGIAIRHARLRAHRRTRPSASSWPSPPTRRSTPGWATRSAWTPPPPRSGCCAACVTPGTTWATASPRTATS